MTNEAVSGEASIPHSQHNQHDLDRRSHYDLELCDSSDAMTLPNWFLKVLALCASILTAGGIPWASWVTYTLLDLQANNQSEETDNNTNKIAALERTQADHNAQFQILQATRFTAEHGRLLTGALEARLDRLDSKFETTLKEISDLRREIDRTISRKSGNTSLPATTLDSKLLNNSPIN